MLAVLGCYTHIVCCSMCIVPDEQAQGRGGYDVILCHVILYHMMVCYVMVHHSIPYYYIFGYRILTYVTL